MRYQIKYILEIFKITLNSYKFVIMFFKLSGSLSQSIKIYNFAYSHFFLVKVKLIFIIFDKKNSHPFQNVESYRTVAVYGTYSLF